MPGICRLIGTVKHYDWGGTSFIPDLLNKENSTRRPFAEYWLGAHQQDECRIIWPDGRSAFLKEYLANHPELLGTAVQKEFDQLPYLLKVLDVNEMLSIQVHPSKASAEKEFARENAEGIPLQAANRNYKDPNHKPELMVACSDFWLLHGFKQEREIKKILNLVPELNNLLPVYINNGYQGLYRYVMEMPQDDVNRLLEPLCRRIIPLYNEGKLNKNQESFWAARAANYFEQPGKIDRGIFSIYFFNLLQLKKGEGIFQGAGLPHAYLEGQNVEIMASSDNVLRGGLTNKHVDVKELLKHVKCEAANIDVLEGESSNKERIYKTNVSDFLLSSIELGEDESYVFTPFTAEIILLLSGRALLKCESQVINLRKGEPAAICFPGLPVSMLSSEKTTVFKASVPRPA